MTGFGADSRPQIDAGRHPDSAAATKVAGGSAGVRCLVLVPRGERISPALRESFARRGIDAEACEDPFSLVARAVSQTKGQRTGGVVVVFAEPARLAFAGDVVDSLRRYAPRASCWLYLSEGGNATLRAVTSGDAQGWSRRTDVRIGNIPEGFGATVSRSDAARKSPPLSAAPGASAPRLRLAGEGQLPPESDPDVRSAKGQAGTAPGEMLTPEELDLLLGDDGTGR